MKALILFCVIFVATSIHAEDAHLTPEQKAKVRQYVGECVKETGVSQELLEEAKKATFPEDENLKKFFSCFFKKSGILSENGELNIDVALQKLPSGIDKAEAEKVLHECKTMTGKDEIDTAYKIFKCYYLGTKQHVIFV